MKAVSSELRLSAQRALLGAIGAGIRLIKVDVTDNWIVLTIYSDEVPANRQLDAISTAATEIVADYPDFGIDERWMVGRDPLPKEDVLEHGWVYQRAET